MSTFYHIRLTKGQIYKILLLYVLLIILVSTISSSLANSLTKLNNDIYSPSYFLTNWRRADNQPIYSKLTPHIPNTIMIHHTGIKTSYKTLVSKLQNLYKFSTMKKNWGDVPYHFYIDKNGSIAVGRSINYAPDTNTDFNTRGYINIVLEGDFSTISKERPSLDQNKSLKEIVTLLKSKYGIKKVVAHNEKAKTFCPGEIDLTSYN